MKQSQIAFQIITSHQLTKSALKKGLDIQSKLVDIKNITMVNVNFSREPDECELYVIEVGHILSHLLLNCEQLIQCILFLSIFSPTKKMKEHGITESHILQYNIENYLIRTQSIYDRILNLINVVFRLEISPRKCTDKAVSKNIDLKETDIPSKLQKLNNLLSKYKLERNVIVHHKAYQEDELRKIEMYHLLISKNDQINSPDYKFFQIIAKDLTQEFIMRKSEEFEQFNETLFVELALLFDSLEPIYHNLQNSLYLKCGY